MGQLAEFFVIGMLVVGGIYLYKHPEIIDQIKQELGNIGKQNNGGNTNIEQTEEEPAPEEENEDKKSKFVAVYSSKPRSVVRTPSTIY